MLKFVGLNRLITNTGEGSLITMDIKLYFFIYINKQINGNNIF